MPRVPSAVLVLPLVASAIAGAIAGCSADEGPAVAGSPDAALIEAAAVLEATTPEDAGVVDAAEAAVSTCPTLGPTDLPSELRCTNLYASWEDKTLAPGVRAFAPGLVLWSDGAVKTRWVYLPPGTQIDTRNMDEWVFPVGTKFWKEFALDGKRIETRLFSKATPNLWTRTTYKWSDDQTRATRLDTGDNAPDGGDPDAGGYEIPSVLKCDQCHDGRTDKVLGFEAVSLAVNGATGVTLADLVLEQRLTVDPPSTTLTIPEDSTGKAARSLGWLHANCGTTCHNRNPAAGCNFRGMYLRLGYEELRPADGGAASVAALDIHKTTYNVDSTLPNATYKRIEPGNTTRSAITYMVGRRNASVLNDQMPPIDTHRVDVEHTTLLRDWITALP